MATNNSVVSFKYLTEMKYNEISSKDQNAFYVVKDMNDKLSLHLGADKFESEIPGYTKLFTESGSSRHASDFSECPLYGCKDIVIVWGASSLGVGSPVQCNYVNTDITTSGEFPGFSNSVWNTSGGWIYLEWDCSVGTGKYITVWGR